MAKTNAVDFTNSYVTKEILSFKEAVQYLDVSKSYLYKLTSQSKISFYKPNNKLIYFKKSDLDNWMLQNKNESTEVLLENIVNNLKERKNAVRIN